MADGPPRQGSEVLYEEQVRLPLFPSIAIYHVHVYTWPSCLHICATVECVFVFRVALWADERCVCVCMHSASEDASNSSLFLGAIWNLSCLLAPPLHTHRHMHACTHTLGCGINIPLYAPGSLHPQAADIVSGWDENTHANRHTGVLAERL